MTDLEYNECCLTNPRSGDYWQEMIASTYFYVVGKKSLDEIIVLKCFGDDSATIDNKDGTYSLDYSKAVVVDREWMRNEVTYSCDRKSFVADCRNSDKSRKIVAEYNAWVKQNTEPSFEDKVNTLQGSIADMRKQLEALMKTCPHTKTKKMGVFYTGGYDHVSEAHNWDECLVCGKQTNKTVELGGYQ